MGQLQLSGKISAGGDGCSCGSGGSATYVLELACGCAGVYGSVVGTAPNSPLYIQTSGLPGDVFVDLPLLEELTAIQFLYVDTTQPMILRIGAAPATVLASGGSYPTGFSGGETFSFTIDGVAVSGTFLIGDQTLAQVCARINAAAALAGLATPRATAVGGQLQLDGILTGSDGSVVVASGTGNTALGLTTGTTLGEGADMTVYGPFMQSSTPKGSTPAPPARVQISGTGNVTIVAAGSTT